MLERQETGSMESRRNDEIAEEGWSSGSFPSGARRA